MQMYHFVITTKEGKKGTLSVFGVTEEEARADMEMMLQALSPILGINPDEVEIKLLEATGIVSIEIPLEPPDDAYKWN